MKRYLGLDLGSKTLGVAISLTGIVASNLTTIRFEEDNYQSALEQLAPIINTNKITTIVLGYPKHMNNDIGIKGKISEDFKDSILKSNPNLTVILQDERLSTKTALRILSDNNKKKEKQKALKDEMAACVILQGYLDSNY